MTRTRILSFIIITALAAGAALVSSMANAVPLSTIILTDTMNENRPNTSEAEAFIPLGDASTALVTEYCNLNNITPKNYGNIRVWEDDLQPLAYQAELQQDTTAISVQDLQFIRSLSSRLANSGRSSLYLSPYQTLRTCAISYALTGEDILELVD